MSDGREPEQLLALGVAPARRREGLATNLLATHVSAGSDGAGCVAEVTVAERDPREPLDRVARRRIARRLLDGAGFQVGQADAAVRAADPDAIAGVLLVEAGRR
jgi:ribosomal protein S18 acetylase RimI-like enzyme